MQNHQPKIAQRGQTVNPQFEWNETTKSFRVATADLRIFEEWLSDAFTRVKLDGHFNLVIDSMIKGSSATKGVTILAATQPPKPFLSFGFQPRGNDSRVKINVPMSPTLVPEVTARLSRLKLPAELPPKLKLVKSDVVQPLVSTMPTVSEQIEVLKELANHEARIVEFGAEESLTLVEFPTSLSEESLTELVDALRPHIEACPPQSVFQVISSPESSTITANGIGIHWLKWDPGQRGVGFCFRARSGDRWQRFSLFAGSSEAIGAVVEGFGETARTSSTLQVSMQRNGKLQSIVDDQFLREKLISMFAELLHHKGLVWGQSSDWSQIVSEYTELTPRAAGKLAQRLKGYLRIQMHSPKATYYDYAVGTMALPFLPPHLRYLVEATGHRARLTSASMELEVPKVVTSDNNQQVVVRHEAVPHHVDTVTESVPQQTEEQVLMQQHVVSPEEDPLVLELAAMVVALEEANIKIDNLQNQQKVDQERIVQLEEQLRQAGLEIDNLKLVNAQRSREEMVAALLEKARQARS